MATRCNSCNQYVSMECADPETDLTAEVSDGLIQVSGSVRCVRTCVDCGDELQETTFEVDNNLDIPEDAPVTELDHEHDLNLEEECESTESGGSRYTKNMIGFMLDYKVTCECGLVVTGQLKDELQASAWDSLV